ncbi:uncharacterized protein LOC125255959 [Megalobrama amblycephala]|uniref:uncharacterized protein LOC125255959 n=1 Tax=Megalobrama amblycephala TaxID=75352 RepID=UPI002014573D|nr:uncharacterized protein LOC125255959 [Megalobrama amblycephala]
MNTKDDVFYVLVMTNHFKAQHMLLKDTKTQCSDYVVQAFTVLRSRCLVTVSRSVETEKQCIDLSQISKFVTSPPGIMSTTSSSSPSLSLSVDNVQRRLCDELLSISSNASCDMEWRWSGYRTDGQSEQIGCGMCCLSLSNSLQGIFCPPLPGQVPVEPAETSNGLTAYGALEASSVINSSTEKPTQHRMKKGFCSLLKRMWKFIKRPFRSCFCSSAVDVVEPFVPPPDLDAEPNPVPDHVGVKPNKGNIILNSIVVLFSH